MRPRPWTVDTNDAVDIYPKVPKPRVVDVKLVEVTSPEPPPPPPKELMVTMPSPFVGEIVTFVPARICVTATLLRPVSVDVKVDASWLEDMYPRVAKPFVVEVKDKLEIYPRVAKPVVVEVKDKLDIYRRVAKPFVVDWRDTAKKGVLTRLDADDRYPKVAKPRILLVKSTSFTLPPDVLIVILLLMSVLMFAFVKSRKNPLVVAEILTPPAELIL